MSQVPGLGHVTSYRHSTLFHWVWVEFIWTGVSTCWLTFEIVCRLCERAVTLRLRARQAKLFFKR
jgi:hypothetical protein